MQPKKSSLAVTLALATFAVILLATSIRANAEKVLYSFQGGSDGSYPTAGLIADKAGNLYGTTAFGGSGACHSRGELGRQTGCGTVFELSPAGDGTWTEKIIYSFQGQQDGSYPYVGLTFDSTGNLYGTTAYGGGNATCVSIEYGCGVVFELTPGSGGDWTEKVLHRFQGGSDGGNPGAVVFDHAGNLYGIASQYGDISGADPYGCGTVFELTPSGNHWTETILYTLAGDPDGCGPNGGLILAAGDVIYGAASVGGTYGEGAIFQLTPASGGVWTESIRYSFGVHDGHIPTGVISDQAGNLYGSNYDGGEGGYGAVFEIDSSGKESLIANLGAYGDWPRGELTFDAAGNLYGTTQHCASTCDGGVFKLTPNVDGGWTLSSLYGFSGGSDGGQPFGGVIVDLQGHVYGTTWVGGTGTCTAGSSGNGCGVVFELDQ